MPQKEPQITRRDLLRYGAVTLAVSASPLTAFEPVRHESTVILDSHVHVWNLKQFHLPWLDHNTTLMRRDYSMADYLAAAEGLNISSAVYVEVNVEPGQRQAEAEYVIDLCKRPDNPILGGVIAGDPGDPKFEEYLDRFKDSPHIKGVRYLYPRDGSTKASFLKGLRLMGERRLSFDLQLGPGLLLDAAATAQACPDTQFILDHCGGAVPQPFRRDFENDGNARQSRELWRAGIAAVAKRSNVSCKISGVADSALPGDATSQDVAPIVAFCLAQFGPDRVLFGGNWPVCLKGTTLSHWVASLKRVVADRTEEDRRKLFHDNAARVYRLSGAAKGTAKT